MSKISKILASFLFVFMASGNAILILMASDATAQSIPNDVLSRPNTPIVTVGGFMNFNAAGMKQDAAFEDLRLPDAKVNAGKVDLTTGTSNNHSRKYVFTNDSEIHIKVGGISDSGIKYGAVVELEANVSDAPIHQGVNADKAFTFAEIPIIGKFEFGNNSAVNQKMKVGPANFARAAGGINGKYLEYINLPMLAHSTQVTASGKICDGGVRVDLNGNPITSGNIGACDNVKLPSFILIPQSPIAHGGYARSFYNTDYLTNNSDSSFNKNRVGTYRDGSFGELEDATKISYYTPRNSGWQLGVSFTPDTGNSGTSAVISSADSGDIKNAISGGINYSDNFGNLGVALSVTGEYGKFEQTSTSTLKRNDLASYDVGLMFTYFGFTIGGSYGSWGKSLQPESGIYSCQYDSSLPLASQDCTNTASTTYKKFDDATYYTGGVAYQFGPIATSITYLASNFQENKYQAGSLGIDYKLARGFMPYVEVTGFKFESDAPTKLSTTDYSTQDQLKDNKGFVVLTGVLFAF